jgi:5-formyltetrahydrofolate cyclo-ligase
MPGGTLLFARYHTGQTLIRNRYGIGEPVKSGRLRKGWSVNTVLLPLVGFDRCGGRLGMGGGYYDRSFRRLATTGTGAPRLVGLAHRVQEVSLLPRERWDLDLSAVATDGEFIVLAQHCSEQNT